LTPADDPPGHVQAAVPEPPRPASPDPAPATRSDPALATRSGPALVTRSDPAPDTHPTPAAHPHKGGMASLTIGALGIVYGDIGTSPLYALNQIFLGRADLPLTPANVLGGISLVIWTITIIVAIKYAIFVLRAQNDGEGGVFALYGLLHQYKRRGTSVLLWSLMLGAGLLFGDGFITPAISVLSAVEGLNVATPALSHLVIPITVALLTMLFAVQFKGTAGIGSVFGPILLLWFVAIGLLGATQIQQQPGILAAFNPLYGLAFLARAGPYDTLLVLGALMLVVTGGEAMYADMGHFGARPIRIGWFSVVYPALLLNYLGQGAFLLSGRPVEGGNLFFSLVPEGLVLPMVLLATVATVIASQALISGAFTLTAQATRLGLFPRLVIRHTHYAHAGQIYLPFINWSLYVGCVLLVVLFGSSAALGAAYGLAVSGVMVITSLAMIAVARIYWHWDRVRILLLWGSLTVINSAFLLASTLKFFEGGFVPLGIGALVFLVMLTWQWGRKATFAAYTAKHTMTLAELVRLHRGCPTFMERNAILMAPKPLRDLTDRAPALMQLLWDRYGILPRNLIFVQVTHNNTAPHIHDGRYRVTVFDRDRQRGSVIGVELHFGFMEEPNVERALEELARHHQIDLPVDRHHWIVHVSLENLLPSRTMGWLRRIRFRLFVLLRRLSQQAHEYYGLGDQVELSAEIIPVRVR
jgi:KUP system potassium uptake protein